LADVHDALRVRLAPLGFRPEDRPFSPHLTIGRAKDVHRADASTIRRILRDARFEPASGEIRHATLFKSRTLPNGSQYEVLLRVPLI
jgi:2'-5' RNA ligase